MSEIATLGLKVDTSEVNSAKRALDGLTNAGAKAQRGANGLAAQFKGISDALARSIMLQERMANSLDKIAAKTMFSAPACGTSSTRSRGSSASCRMVARIRKKRKRLRVCADERSVAQNARAGMVGCPGSPSQQSSEKTA